MDTENLIIKQGARLNFIIYREDPTATSATFLARFENNVITKQVTYVIITPADPDTGAEAVWGAPFQFNSADGTNIPGTYEYQVSENFPTGSPDIYPAGGDCADDEECENPTLIICESIQGGS